MSEETLEQKVGAKLTALREKKKLTQPEAAKGAGVSARSIFAWEKGENLPGGKNLKKLAEFYGVTPASLMR